MRDWVEIQEVAAINPKSVILDISDDTPVTFLPMAGVSEDGYVSYQEERAFAEVCKGYTCFEEGDILLAKITPCMENGKAALVSNLTNRIGFGSTEFHVLRPGNKIDGKYLFYMIWNPFFRQFARENMTGSAGQKRVPVESVKRYRIPLPSPETQRRIADVLDNAQELIDKRKQQIEMLDEFLRSVFLDTVGPGAEGYSTWTKERIDRLAVKGGMRTGPFGSDLLHSEFVDEGVAVLGIDNAVENRFEWGQKRYITPKKYQSLKRYTVYPGDVIVTIMGTTGRSAVIPEGIPLSISTKHLATISLNQEKANPYFISYCIHSHPDVLRQIQAQNQGAIMSGLNLTKIKALVISVPPLALQKQFAEILDQVENKRALMQQSLLEMENAFNSIMQKAFKGELFS